jgi:bacterioferritin
MKGNPKLIEQLNARLAEELTAINQYMVHAEMCDNWNYKKHAEKLIARILFLEGIPVVSNLNKVHIGADVPKMHASDRVAEETAIKNYNDTIKLAAEVGDNGTRDFLQSILNDEEEHLDWIEAQQDQIGQLGIQNYLVEQIG